VTELFLTVDPAHKYHQHTTYPKNIGYLELLVGKWYIFPHIILKNEDSQQNQEAFLLDFIMVNPAFMSELNRELTKYCEYHEQSVNDLCFH